MFLSLVALILSAAWVIFGKQPYQKHLSYVIGSGASLLFSIIFAVLVEKTQIIQKILPLNTSTINDWLDRTAFIVAALIIYLGIVITKIVSHLFKPQ